MISEDGLTKFQELYKKRFGVELSRKDALEKSIELLRLVECIYKPITKDEYDRLQKRRQEHG